MEHELVHQLKAHPNVIDLVAGRDLENGQWRDILITRYRFSKQDVIDGAWTPPKEIIQLGAQIATAAVAASVVYYPG